MKKKLKNSLLYLLRTLPSTLHAYLSDFYRWTKYSIRDNNRVNKQHEQARILLILHALEKGLSFKNGKKGFGKEKALDLVMRTLKYLQKYPPDEISNLSLGVLSSYIQSENSWKSEKLVKNYEVLLEKSSLKMIELYGGVKSVEKKKYVDFSTSYDDLYRVASSRTSVREFSEQHVTSSEIEKAVKYAKTAPSVCNRQASRVHVFNSDLDVILQTQLGNQGWADRANKLFVITVDLNFFGSLYERNQAFIDGGMFAMQFVMGLHVQKIASCCKMYIRKPKLDKKFYSVTKIPANEVPIMLILAGHYQEDAVNVPYSHRLEFKNSIVFHG